MCKRRLCLWSHPSRGHRSFVGLVVTYRRWLELRIQRVASTAHPRTLEQAPGTLGKTDSFLRVGGTRLLRSGGPCIRPKQLAFPVSPDLPPPLLGQQVTPNVWIPEDPATAKRKRLLPACLCGRAGLVVRHHLAACCRTSILNTGRSILLWVLI